jgi:GMP synthase (glutamine-hydrolysing)
LAEKFDAEEFIRSKTVEVKSATEGQKTVLACSGGLCSNVVATIVQRATGGENLLSVFIDTGFMRKNEAETVKDILSRAPLKLDLKVIEARKRFMKNVEKVEAPEEKRKAFYETFYSLLRDFAEEKDAKSVLLGTSVRMNGINSEPAETRPSKGLSKERSIPVVEPLTVLNRHQVSKLAEHLGLPPRLADLNPFPMPGLMLRAVGSINDDKVKDARDATEIVEEEFQYIKPTQYFAAILENKNDDETKIEKIRERVSDYLDVGPEQVELVVPRSKVAGLREGKRVYLKLSASRVTLLGSKELLEPDFDDLTSFPVEFVEKQKEFTRCLYNITRKPKNGKYMAVVRAVTTEDFLSANVVRLDWNKLYTISERVMSKCGKVSSVYYDVTPKPPAAIEFE